MVVNGYHPLRGECSHHVSLRAISSVDRNLAPDALIDKATANVIEARRLTRERNVAANVYFNEALGNLRLAKEKLIGLRGKESTLSDVEYSIACIEKLQANMQVKLFGRALTDSSTECKPEKAADGGQAPTFEIITDPNWARNNK